MIKNWKHLFVKADETEAEVKATSKESFSFPTGGHAISATPAAAPAPVPAIDPNLAEVLEAYESGLDSINMPGYDFYEFYKSVSSIGNSGEAVYNMAFQMARTLDSTITPGKLLNDAEFYISKINEVHGQYVNKGQLKLTAIQEKKNTERTKLQSDIDHASQRINQLRQELQQLEADVTQKRAVLSKLEDQYFPQEKAIREKLNANDVARQTSIDRLNIVKSGIQRFIKF
jgi:hypothetical protein